jgi:hypothetical protein
VNRPAVIDRMPGEIRDEVAQLREAFPDQRFEVEREPVTGVVRAWMA